MVQALGKLLADANFDISIFEKVASNFSCSKNKELEDFLINKAIDLEVKNLARTFLILDDTNLKSGLIKINGYFSISIKSILLQANLSNSKKIALSKNKSSTHIAGFLLGQIAKDDSMPKGFGNEILETAISKIRLAQENASCRFMYLDCVKPLETYYRKNNFKFMQINPEDTKYIQMYILI